MKKTEADKENRNKVENLRRMLREFGINSPEELDAALAETLEAMTIGIMTETIKTPANSA